MTFFFVLRNVKSRYSRRKTIYNILLGGWKTCRLEVKVKDPFPLNTLHTHVFSAVTKVKIGWIRGTSLHCGITQTWTKVQTSRRQSFTCLLILHPWGEDSDHLTRPFQGFSRSSSSDAWNAGRMSDSGLLRNCCPMGPKVWGVRNSRIKEWLWNWHLFL